MDEYLFDIFKNQYYTQLAIIETLIAQLDSKTTYKQNVDQLFRIFHNFKSSTTYLGLDTMKELIEEVENVLEVLRTENGPAKKEILQWFDSLVSHLFCWRDELENDIQALSKAPNTLLNKIRFVPSKMKVEDTLKTLNILYIDANKKRSKKLIGLLNSLFIDINHRASLDEVQKFDTSQICILYIESEALQDIKIYQERLPNTQFIVVVNKITERIRSKLMLQGIASFIEASHLEKNLMRELYNITSSYFSGRKILISNEKIYKFIQSLEPLPSSISKIQAICNDEDSSIHQLIQVVQEDPILTSSILNATKSPIYGLKNIKAIHQAVSIFGKKTIQSIVFSGLSKNIGTFELDPYCMNEEMFSRTVALRLTLMLQWYTQVSPHALSLLSLSAVLGNIGQILLSKEIQERGEKDHFIRESVLYGFQTAEENIFHTNTTSISSDILNYWKLDSELVDSIKYSDRPYEAPKDIQAYCIANYIVFNTVLLDGTIVQEISEDILSVMKKEKLDPSALEKAIQYIKEK